MSRKQSSSAPAASYIAACSTGSPASRSDTKLTPLTTRPSFTSRQGITRSFNIGNALESAPVQDARTYAHHGMQTGLQPDDVNTHPDLASKKCQRLPRID